MPTLAAPRNIKSAVIFGAALLLAGALTAMPGAVRADETTAKDDVVRTITVSGEGKVTAKPDTASISTGVVTEGKTAREALTANSKEMAKVIDGMKEAGIDADDIQTSGFSVNPVYSQPPRANDGSRPEPKITGYRASNNVTVVIRDLDKVGSVLDKAVTLGANNVNGVSFFIDKPEPLLDEARSLAVADAMRKASILATAAKVDLGGIVTMNEGGAYAPQPKLMRGAVMAEAADFAVPVEAGTQEMRANVSIVFQIR